VERPASDDEAAPRRRRPEADGPTKTKIRGESPAPQAAKPERAPEPRSAKPERSPEPRAARPERTSEPRRRDDDDGPKVKGLGDHVPAFLMRPVKVG
jgi:hypothetical protein